MAEFKAKLNPFTGQLQLIPTNVVLEFKAGVAAQANLPLSGNEKGDARIANDTGHLYVWSIESATGQLTDWVDAGDIVDLTWSALTGKPSSSIADIDDAVSKKHEHDIDVLEGGTPSASSELEGCEADKACDNDWTEWSGWYSEDISLPHWWKYDLGEGVTKTVIYLKIKQYNIKTAIIQGSNNDSDWDNIDTLSFPVTTEENPIATSTFGFINTTAYRYYRLNITEVYHLWGENVAGIDEIELKEECSLIGIADTVSKKHTQNTDTILDQGGANEIDVTEIPKKLTEGKTYYIDPISGDNENSGTELEPFQTIQHAIDITPKFLNGFEVRMKLVDGIYNEELTIRDFVNGIIWLQGLSDNPNSCIIQNNTANNVVLFFNNNCIGGAEGIGFKALSDNQLCWLVELSSFMQLINCKLGDNDNTGTVGIRTSASHVDLRTVTDLDENKVDIGLDIDSGSLVTIYDTTDIGDTFYNLTSGILTDKVYINSTDYNDAVDKKHTQNSDTSLGTQTSDINMGTHKLTSLSVPASNGDSIRATTKITEANLEDSIDKKHANTLDHTQNTDIGTSNNFDITGEISIKVYSQNDEPTLGQDNRMAVWIDTDDSNRTYILFRRGDGDQVAVELA